MRVVPSPGSESPRRKNRFSLLVHAHSLKLILALGAVLTLFVVAAAQDDEALLQVTLYSKITHRNWSRSSVNFESGERGSPTADASGFDLIYGTLAINDDSNWFEVRDGRSMIYDLGKKQFSDFKETPSFPKSKKPQKPRPLTGDLKEVNASNGSKEISPYQQYVPVKAGHIYLMKVVRDRKKTYVMFRVDELISEDNCRLSWKKVPPPPQDIEGPKN